MAGSANTQQQLQLQGSVSLGWSSCLFLCFATQTYQISSTEFQVGFRATQTTGDEWGAERDRKTEVQVGGIQRSLKENYEQEA